MATIFFNDQNFRALFPPYSSTSAFPSSVLQLYWDTATAYINDRLNCSGGLKPAQQTLALNLMTAHLTYLTQLSNSGQAGGITTAATVDKVSVTLQPPPEVNQWQWWLNQSPYGQELLALLQIAAVGGLYIGGFPTAYSLRR